MGKIEKTMTLYIDEIRNGLHDLLESDERVYLMGEDLRDPYGGAFKVTRGLSQKFPDRILNMPISEAGFTGFAVGMALRGLRPVVEIMFGDFITLATDQIVTNLSKLKWMYNDQVEVPVTIRTPMGGRRGYGPTHSQSLEKLFFGIPNIKIVSPSIFHNVKQLLVNSVQDDSPLLFIENKLDYNRQLVVNENSMADFFFVKTGNGPFPVVQASPTNFESDDLAILTYGGMAPYVFEAVRYLMIEEEIAVQIIIPSQIHPLPIEELLLSLKHFGKIIIVEEGTRDWGWGAECAAVISEKNLAALTTPVRRIGAANSPIGNAQQQENATLPQLEQIISEIREIYHA